MTDLEKLDEAVARAILSESYRLKDEVWDFSEEAKAARIGLLSHLDAEGWQVVPKVITGEMETVMAWGHSGPQHDWTAALAAAPTFGGLND